ncbi:hypothetical protein [Rugamonas rivuli]|uniref:Uncharacterized protein n=1 Tax=Rugamonas rivuli TaxID=2743358 RepID=A0A843SMB8_9BURK|nr:hypothetical protein [Rugamonas rivuli]MQA21927.1 hypothetical protein [Rugamonas rivuli]
MKSLIFSLLFLFVTNVWSQEVILQRVYIDKAKNVHAIAMNGKEKLLTKGGRATQAELSKDKRTAAWLIENTWTAEGDVGPGASNLTLYRDGKFVHIECQPFIRDFWFWEDGKKVGIDCGGRHFAGTLTLYDVGTGKVIESLFQPDVPYEKLPAWAAPH